MSKNFSHYSQRADFYSVIKNVEIFSLIATEFNLLPAKCHKSKIFHSSRKFPNLWWQVFLLVFQVIKKLSRFVPLMSLIIRLLIKYQISRWFVSRFCASLYVRIMFHVAFSLYPIWDINSRHSFLKQTRSPCFNDK